MNEDERGDAFRGTPKLRLLVVLEYYLGGALGTPKLRLLPLLNYSIVHQIFTQNLKTSQHKTQQKTRKLRQYKEIKSPLLVLCELILYLYWCNIYCIPTSLWFIPSDTTHRFIKISKQHIENRMCQKQNSLQLKVQSCS